MKFFSKKIKTGLVLSSGAARGLAHIGAIKALKEKNTTINMICGASIGALIGACYARNEEISNLEDLVLRMDWKKLLQLADPNLVFMLKGIVHGERIKELLKTVIGDIQFKDLKIPLAIITTDVSTGEEIVRKEGSVLEAVRASISIPVIFMPVKIGNRFLIDGGIVNPVPVKTAKEMGATRIIACNVIHSPAQRRLSKLKKRQNIKKHESTKKDSVCIKNTVFGKFNDQINVFIRESSKATDSFGKLANDFKSKILKTFPEAYTHAPNIFDVLTQSLYSMEYKIAQSTLKEADIIINPDTTDIATLEFMRGKEAISKGYEAAMSTLK